jgi:hypothetical protein
MSRDIKTPPSMSLPIVRKRQAFFYWPRYFLSSLLTPHLKYTPQIPGKEAGSHFPGDSFTGYQTARTPMNGVSRRRAGSPEHPRDAGLFLDDTIPDMSDQWGTAYFKRFKVQIGNVLKETCSLRADRPSFVRWYSRVLPAPGSGRLYAGEERSSSF